MESVKLNNKEEDEVRTSCLSLSCFIQFKTLVYIQQMSSCMFNLSLRVLWAERRAHSSETSVHPSRDGTRADGKEPV